MILSKAVWLQRLGASAVLCVALYVEVRILGLFYGTVSFTLTKFVLAPATVIGVIVLMIDAHSFHTHWRVPLAVAFLGCLGAATVAQILLTPDLADAEARYAHTFLLATAGYAASWFFVGYAVQVVHVERSWWKALMLWAAIAVPVAGALNGGYLVDYYLLNKYIGADSFANHLVAGSAAYLVLLAAYSIAPVRLRVWIFSVSVPVLFALGGRSDLATYIIAILGFEWLVGIKRSKFTQLMSVLLFAVGMIAVVMPAQIWESTDVSRMLFSHGLSSDSSVDARVMLLDTGIRDFPEQALFGDITRLAERHGSYGTYIHNVFSAWQFFGVIVFLLIIFMFVMNIRRVIRVAKRGGNVADVFGVLLFLSAALGALLSKSITDVLIWFSLGFWSANDRLSKLDDCQSMSVGG